MIGFTFFLLSAIMMASGLYITRYNLKGHLSTRYVLVLLLWTIYIISVVESGVLKNFSVPLIPLLIVIPAFVIILYTTSRPAFKVAVSSLPVYVPIFVQSFRILVELMIYGAFLEGVLPKSVTFRGWNYDILVGFSALVVGFLAMEDRIHARGILIWNVLSLLILAVTVSSFARFIYFSGEQLSDVNLRFFQFPYILLPCVLVPFALFYHVISIRQSLARE